MSNRHLDHVFAYGPSSRSDRLVLLALADRADSATGLCDPSMNDIAARSFMTVRGARKVVRRLEAAGWLEVDVCRGRGNRSRYRVVLLRADSQEIRNEKPEQPDRFNEKTGTQVHENRNGGSAEPLEPSYGGDGERARELKATEIAATAAPEPPGRAAAVEVHSWREQLIEVLGPSVNPRRICNPEDMLEARRWETDLGLTRPEILAVIEHVMAQFRAEPPTSLKYFRRPMQRLATEKAELSRHTQQQRPGQDQSHERNHYHQPDNSNVYDARSRFAKGQSGDVAFLRTMEERGFPDDEAGSILGADDVSRDRGNSGL